MATGLNGLNNVLKKLNQEVQGIKNRNLAGLISAAILINQKMNKNYPRIPANTGNLRSSWFVVTSKGGIKAGKSPTFKGDGAEKLSSGHGEKVEASKFFAMAVAEDTGAPALTMGFTAFYAWYVHEKVGENVKWNRKNSGPKFFVTVLKTNHKEILKEIQDEVKIK